MKHAEFFKKIAVVIIFNTIAVVNAQNYRTAIGLCSGPQSGLTIKHFVNSNGAIEGIFSLWPYRPAITVLYEVYAPTGARNLSWYYGGGAHVAFYGPGYYYYPPYEGRYYPYMYYYGGGFGLDATLGLEFKFPKVPIAISGDLKPFIHFPPYGYVYGGIYPCLGIKLAF